MANPTTGSETVLFNIDGSLAGIRTQLAEVSKLSGQAGKNMAAGIAGQLNALQTQLAKATAATRTLGTASTASMGAMNASAGMAKASLFSLQQQLMDVGVMLQGGMNPMTILATQGPQIATAVQQMGGMTPLLARIAPMAGAAATAVGAMAVAVAAVGTAYVVYENKLSGAANTTDEMNERVAKMGNVSDLTKEQVDALAKAWASFDSIVGDAQDAVDIINGKLTKSGAELAKQQEKLNKVAGETVQQEAKRIAELKMSIDANHALSMSTTEDAETRIAASAAMVKQQRELDQLEPKFRTHRQELDKTNQNMKDAAEYADALADSNEFLRKREEAEAEAKRRAAEAARKLADELERQKKAYLALVDAMDEETAAQVEGRAAAEDLRAMSHAATESTLSDIDKVIDKRDDELKRALATYQDGVKAAGANDATLLALDEAYWDARIDITTAANVELAKLEQKRRDDQKKEDDKAAKAQLAAFQSALSMASQLSSYVASSTGESYSYIVDNLAKTQAYAQQVDEYLTDSQREELDKRMDAQKKAATEAFRMNQAAQFATAAINGISAAVAAWNAGMQSAPGPFALVTAGAFTAASVLATGAQLAAIASQQPAFHSGGLAPDERMYRMIPGEMAVSKQGVSAAGGREAFDRMNAGVSTGGGTIYAVTSYRHTNQVARYEADRLARNSPTMQEISRGRTPGVRSL